MRYIIALIISIVGVAASYKFLRPQYEVPKSLESANPVATVMFIGGSSVKRMQAGQAFWVDAKNHSEIYEGDAIKTDDFTTAKISFLGSKTQLRVQPKTRLVVNKVGKAYEVEDVEGTLFVENSLVKSDLHIRSGKKIIDVTGGSARIDIRGKKVNLVAKGGNISTQLNGKKEVISGNQVALVSGLNFKRIKVDFREVLPLNESVVYIDKKKSLVKFQWEKLKELYDFEILMGSAIDKLAPISQSAIARSTPTSITARVNRGSHIWKIKGVNKKNAQKVIYSEPYTFKAQYFYPISLKTPARGEQVRFSSTQKNKKLRLHWFSATPLEKSYVEVATDKKMQNIIYTRETDKTAARVELDEGQYYWRVTATPAGSNQQKKTSVGQFRVQYLTSSFPPKLVYPQDQSQFVLKNNQESQSVILSWDRTALAIRYRLRIKGSNNFYYDKDLKNPTREMSNLRPGKYTWQVATVSSDGKASRYSPVRSFEVKRQARIQWLQQDDDFLYIGRPNVSISWKRIRQADSYRLAYADNPSFNEAKSRVFNNSKVRLGIKEDGVYSIRVEALDNNGDVIASSRIRQITVAERPLPESPALLTKATLLRATKDGSLDLKFRKLKTRENKIVVKIMDQAGDVIRLLRLKSNKTKVTGLLPGEFTLSAYTEDKYDRRSVAMQTRDLTVPTESSLRPPKFDNITIR